MAASVSSDVSESWPSTADAAGSRAEPSLASTLRSEIAMQPKSTRSRWDPGWLVPDGREAMMVQTHRWPLALSWSTSEAASVL